MLNGGFHKFGVPPMAGWLKYVQIMGHPIEKWILGLARLASEIPMIFWESYYGNDQNNTFKFILPIFFRTPNMLFLGYYSPPKHGDYRWFWFIHMGIQKFLWKPRCCEYSEWGRAPNLSSNLGVMFPKQFWASPILGKHSASFAAPNMAGPNIFHLNTITIQFDTLMVLLGFTVSTITASSQVMSPNVPFREKWLNPQSQYDETLPTLRPFWQVFLGYVSLLKPCELAFFVGWTLAGHLVMCVCVCLTILCYSIFSNHGASPFFWG